MDPSGGAARFRIRRTKSSSDRFLGVFTRSLPKIAVSGVVGDELSEDDVFWTGDFAEHNHSSNAPSTSSSAASRSHNHHNHGKGIGRAENFGILAALPVTESDQSNFQTRSVFNHKASVSSSSSSSSASSSRMIPTIPKKPLLDRHLLKYHQSAPVNVPVMLRRRAMPQFDDIHDYDNEGDGELLPPHEVVASRQSPMAACSVLEGVGRTLKGRDLRQVRNAVWRKTGFLDS